MLLLCCLFLAFAPPFLPWGQEMTHPNLFSEDSGTVAKADPWLGYHGYLLLVTSFAMLHLPFMCYVAPTLQSSIEKLTGHI